MIRQSRSTTSVFHVCSLLRRTREIRLGPTRRTLQVWVLAASTTVLWASGAEPGEFKRVEEFPQGKQTELLASAILSGLGLSHSVERVYPSPRERVWAAAKKAAEQLDKVGGRQVVSVDDKTGRIQNGKISQDESLGAGRGAWLDEVHTEITPVSEGETKVVVSRRVVQTTLKRRRGGYEREWRSAKSNGQVENWVLTRIEDAIAALAAEPVAPEPKTARPELKEGAGIESRLEKLRELKEKNVISEAEYQAMRQRVLEGLLTPPSAPVKE